ncbi:MAG: 3'(2'),5'-bisphosphate nucleotidase CysQ [Saprospiraceae bacterium]
MDKIKLAGEVAQIARRAGAAILSVYANVDEMPVELKSDASPLTLADKASNDIITSGLVQLSVKFPIISEESKLVAYEERCQYEHFWMVDPLDGTKEFLKRNGEFAVNIALLEHDRPIIGVVYVPVTDELFWAVEGGGAYLERQGEQVQLQAAPFHLDDVGLNVLYSRSHMNAETAEFIKQFRQPNLLSKGSVIKFLMLAKGEAHLYPRMGGTSEWDTCPAQLILEEAGGKVIDWETKLPMRYNKESLANPYFVAYGNVNSK